MELEIDQARLLSALSLAQTVADKRSTMPVLANVLLRATSDGHLVCAATDMMIALTESVAATVKSTGSVTVGVRHLHGVVRTHLLSDLLVKTQFSVSTDEARVNLNGVLFECDGATATTVSTDGHRLTRYTCRFPGPKLDKGIIIPRKGMLEIRRLLDRVQGDVSLGIGEQHLFVKAEELAMSVKLNSVQFPPYKAVIPTNHQRRVVVTREELLSALRRAEVMAPEKTATVRLQLAKGKLELTADNPDLGVAHQELPVDYDGEALVAGFNARYLIEILEVIDGPEVALEFQGELDPCVIKPVDGPDLLGVVMPMRI
jgi:DNA polymerase-3 subunit beta